MSHFEQYRGNGERFCMYSESSHDQMSESVAANTRAISELTTSIQTLTTYHKEVTRWLLVVVCVIALGAKLVEMAKDIWGHDINVLAASQ